MAALHGLSIPLEDLGLDEDAIAVVKRNLPKDAIYEGKKTYLGLTVSINDRVDKFGNNVSAWLNQSKEDRDAKADKKFIGSGKVFWTRDGVQTAKALQSDESHDDIPF